MTVLSEKAILREHDETEHPSFTDKAKPAIMVLRWFFFYEERAGQRVEIISISQNQLANASWFCFGVLDRCND